MNDDAKKQQKVDFAAKNATKLKEMQDVRTKELKEIEE